jgi:hypothetical protein
MSQTRYQSLGISRTQGVLMAVGGLLAGAVLTAGAFLLFDGGGAPAACENALGTAEAAFGDYQTALENRQEVIDVAVITRNGTYVDDLNLKYRLYRAQIEGRTSHFDTAREECLG